MCTHARIYLALTFFFLHEAGAGGHCATLARLSRTRGHPIEDRCLQTGLEEGQREGLGDEN